MRTLVILDAYDPGLPGVRTFYLTSGTAFITAASETPASQAFDPVLAQPLDVRRRVQSIRGGAVLPTIGDLRLDNQDGTYDAWLGYAFDGRALVVRVGPDAGAYPADYPVVYTGQMDRLDVQDDAIVIRVRDAQAALDAPLQATLYAGDNVPPDGVEGGAELEGRPKPLVFGSVKGVPLVPVNAQKLIYQISDSALESVEAVYDRGIPLGIAVQFTSTATKANARGMCYGDGRFVVTRTDGASGGVSVSTDGATWTDYTATGVSLLCVTHGEGTYVAGGYTGTLRTSTDAASWTSRTSGFTGDIVALAHGDGIFVGTSSAAEVRRSVDGTTWTAGTTPSANLLSVVYGERPKLFCAVGVGGLITTSPDGTTWTARTSNTTDTLRHVHFGGDLFVACGNNGTIVTSPDGIAWTQRNSGLPSTAILQAGLYVHARHFLSQSTINDPLIESPDGDAWQARGNGVSSIGSMATDGTRIAFAGSLLGTGSGRLIASDLPIAYATLTDLEDDTQAPAPGLWGWFGDSNGTYVRLGGTPDGTVTADATHGATAADRTAGQLFTAVLTRAGFTSGDWNAADITALDTADAAEIGLFLDDETTVSDALDAIARTVGAWWAVDADGDFRIQQLTAPSGASTFTITANDLRGGLERLASSDPLLGRPSYRTTLRYALADSTLLDGTVVDTDTAVQTTHLLAEATVEDTLYTTASDAQAEATRRQTLRGTARAAYRVTVSFADYGTIDLGDIGTLQHPRFGLSAGVLVRVLGVEPDLRNRSVTLTLWR